jgi:peptidoglycan/xylan/chitin deacetylase (PgdA/CDA1 family)
MKLGLLDHLIKYLPELSGLRVLMYHKLSSTIADKLTVKTHDFHQQLLYLIDEGYHFLSLSELHEIINGQKSLRLKSILLTFDDAYKNNRDLASPLLEKLSLKYVIFLPVGHLGKTNSWDEGNDELLSFDELRKMKNRYVEYALHSFSHQNYNQLSVAEIASDLKKCFETLQKEEVPYLPSLAYPYGASPRGKTQIEMFDLFKQLGIKSAFRIGNSLNHNFDQPYLLRRIDIQGQRSLNEFKLQIKFGKIKI